MYRVGQIVRVLSNDCCLYAEVRNLATSSAGEPLCWARPLVLLSESPQDVRRAMDVIWPIGWFTPAYDVELLELWAFLDWEQVVFLGPSPEHISLLQRFTQGLYREIYSPVA